MKKYIGLLIGICVFAFASAAEANWGNQQNTSGSRVNGYYRSNGTYVAPHYRSSRDGYHNNNWSVEGNVNPYNGNRGTKPRW